jgi:hypothetical protein
MGNQVQYNNEKVTKKAVIFVNATGASVTIKDGWLVCYDADYGTATADVPLRAMRVEVPTLANAKNFAGVIDNGESFVVANGATQKISIIVPSKRGQKINIFTDQSCTQDTTLLSLKAGHVAGASTSGPVIARALQTVDRSSTNGLVQAEFFGLGEEAQMGSANLFTASSRTAVQLPTAGIWNNFPIAEMRKNPFLGKLYESDFRHGEALPPHFADATYAAAALGKTPVEGIYPGLADVGELVLFSTEDNGAAELQWPVPIDIAGGGIWAFEVRIKCVNITTEKGSWFAGLNTPANLAGNLQVDGGATPAAVSDIGFNTDAAATAALDTTYLLTGQSRNTHAAGIHTLVANTYVTLGLYYNGTDILQYVNGVNVGTDILGTGDMDQADFPLAAILVPSINMKGAHADDYSVTVDWIRVAQV